MARDFQKLMAGESDKGLQECLDNRAKFEPSAVEAAIAEMQKRGRTFSDEELSTITQELQLRKEATENEERNFFGDGDMNVAGDEIAPTYYSQQAITIFTVLFGVLFGSVLLAINFLNTQSKKGMAEVITFGLLYTSLQIYILSFIPRNTGLTLAFSYGGAFVLTQFFWKKYIGKDTKYRTRSIWPPLTIAIAILVPIFLIIFFGHNPN